MLKCKTPEDELLDRENKAKKEETERLAHEYELLTTGLDVS